MGGRGQPDPKKPKAALNKVNTRQSRTQQEFEYETDSELDKSRDTTISNELKALIKDTVENEIQALSSSLELTLNEKQTLLDKVNSLEKRLKLTEGLLIQAQTKLRLQNEKIIDLQSRSMRENLVIKGIPEDDNESWEKTREKVVDLMKNELGIDNSSIEMIDRAHRIGAKNPKNRNSRSIVAKFSTSDAKGGIFKNIRKLAGKNISINEQLPPEVQERRNRLWHKFKEAKARAKEDRTVKVTWQYDKLKVNDKIYTAVDDIRCINPSDHENDVDMKHSPLIKDSGSTFQAHAAHLSPDVSVSDVLATLYQNRNVANAEHNIYAYRYRVGANVQEGYSDDGEHGASKHLLELLQKESCTDAMLVCTRWFGGIHIGQKRFDHINNCSKNALELLLKKNHGIQGSQP